MQVEVDERSEPPKNAPLHPTKDFFLELPTFVTFPPLSL